jgi:hypothetical protein
VAAAPADPVRAAVLTLSIDEMKARLRANDQIVRWKKQTDRFALRSADLSAAHICLAARLLCVVRSVARSPSCRSA